jgi:hypothetical protein
MDRCSRVVAFAAVDGWSRLSPAPPQATPPAACDRVRARRLVGVDRPPMAARTSASSRGSLGLSGGDLAGDDGGVFADPV